VLHVLDKLTFPNAVLPCHSPQFLCISIVPSHPHPVVVVLSSCSSSSSYSSRHRHAPRMHLASSRSQRWYGVLALPWSRSSWSSSQCSPFPPHEQGLAAVVGGAMVAVVAAVWSPMLSSSINIKKTLASNNEMKREKKNTYE
jgi:hypothetical protein